MGGGKNTIDESYITFRGGKSWSSGVSAIDAAMSSCHSANRLAFADPSGVLIEYSNSGGETWLDYGASDGAKRLLCLGQSNQPLFYIGKKTDEAANSNDLLRITLIGSALGIYVHCKKFLINVNCNGAKQCYCRIEKLYYENVDADTWDIVGTYPISGESNWNSIPVSAYFGLSGADKVHSFRFTFYISEESSGNLSVNNLFLFAPTAFSVNSNLGSWGHVYRYSSSRDMITFPFSIGFDDTSNSFQGNLTGLAAKATADANGNNIANTYVRLDGKSTMTDSLKVNRSAYPQFYLTSNQNSEWYNGRIMVGDKNLVLELRQSESDSNKIGISLFGNNSLEKQLQFRKVVDDTYTYYNIYGTHNLTCGTADLTAGTSALNTSCIYLVYE